MDSLLMAINSCKTGSTPGPDYIPNVFLKNLPITAKLLLLEIINQSWTEGRLPQEWKVSHIIPILKPKNNKEDLNSYRPISLLNTISKLMERMVTNRLLNYLEINNLFNAFQCGFRKGHCTTDHIVRLKTEAEFAIKSGNITVAIFIDFTKAFDLLWRDGLVLKLMKLNIKGLCLKWIKNFLENRSSHVVIDSFLSDSFDFDNGTPQGSVISPILFLIMINDFPILSDFTRSALFADDSSIWRSETNLHQILHHLQEDLNKIELWCKDWGFTINTVKTIGIVFSNKRTLHQPVLTINNSKINFQSTCVFLGVTFDTHLTWSAHIANLCNRASSVLNILRSICGQKCGVNKKTILAVYRALIRSVFDYACIAYDSASKSQLKLLDAVQYKALLLVTGAQLPPRHLVIAHSTENTIS